MSAGAFTFSMPYLHRDTDFTRVTRILIEQMRRQVIQNVVLTAPNTDYSGAPATGLTFLAKIPALSLVGPTLSYANYETEHQNQVLGGGVPGEVFEERRSFKRYHLDFEVTAISDNHREIESLKEIYLLFLQNNTRLAVAKDPDDPAAGTIEYQVTELSPPATSSQRIVGLANTKTWIAAFRVEAVEVESYFGFEGDGIVYRGGVVASTLVENESVG